jgi:hypothetical protein
MLQRLPQITFTQEASPTTETMMDQSATGACSKLSPTAAGYEKMEMDSSKPIELSFQTWLEAMSIALKYKKELCPSEKAPHTSSSSDDETSTTPTPQQQQPQSTMVGLEAAVAGIEVENVRIDLQRILHTAASNFGRVFGNAAGSTAASSGTSKSRATSNPPVLTMPRFYTCPLDQVVQDLQDPIFARLFTDQDQEKLIFSESVHEIMRLFCKSVLRVAKEDFTENAENNELILDERVPFEVWNTCAFTIQASIHSGLDSGKASLLDTSVMSTRNRDCLAALVRYGVVFCL